MQLETEPDIDHNQFIGSEEADALGDGITGY